jgi:hypothetical protein
MTPCQVTARVPDRTRAGRSIDFSPPFIPFSIRSPSVCHIRHRRRLHYFGRFPSFLFRIRPLPVSVWLRATNLKPPADERPQARLGLARSLSYEPDDPARHRRLRQSGDSDPDLRHLRQLSLSPLSRYALYRQVSEYRSTTAFQRLVRALRVGTSSVADSRTLPTFRYS